MGRALCSMYSQVKPRSRSSAIGVKVGKHRCDEETMDLTRRERETCQARGCVRRTG